MRAVFAFTLASLYAPLAQAAEVTEMPPWLRGDVSVNYQGTYQTGSMNEDDVNVGVRRVSRQDVTIGGEFTYVEGCSLGIAIPVTADYRFTYPDSRTMSIEPVGGGGTYQFSTPSGQLTEIRGSGLQGVWFDLAFAPFAERFKKKHQVTWRLDLGVRTPSKKSNIWTVTDGKRGASNGGTAFKIAAAFSAQKRRTDPYLSVQYIRENAVTLDIVDESGATQANALRILPPSSLDVRAGIELLTYEDASDSRVAVDLFMGFGYRTFGNIPSGILLPNVLDASKKIAVNVDDHLLAKAGFSINARIVKYVGLRAGFDGTYYSPYLLENVYPVRISPDTVQLGWNFALTGRIR